MNQQYRGSRRWTAFLALALPLGGVACDEDPFGLGPGPTIDAVVGSYDAADAFGAFSFTTTDDGETTNWLAAGAEFVISLYADGSTSGRLFIPGPDEDDSDMDVDLTGSWSLSGSTVTFEHAADTFVRDMPFTFNSGTLVGDRTFSGVRVQVVLVRQ